jgi:hypothetical protein
MKNRPANNHGATRKATPRFYTISDIADCKLRGERYRNPSNEWLCEEEGAPPEFVEVGDLSCREIKPGKAITSLFSHHGDRQSGRKRGAPAAIGQTLRKPSRLERLYTRVGG